MVKFLQRFFGISVVLYGARSLILMNEVFLANLPIGRSRSDVEILLLRIFEYFAFDFCV